MRLVEAKRGRFLVFEKDPTIGTSLIDMGEVCEAQAEFFDDVLRPGTVVVEVGANIGTHTVTFARKAKVVHAFEPQRRVFNVLCGNLALNGIDNVECYRVAGGDKRERIEIPSCDFEDVCSPGSFSLDIAGDKTDYVDVVPINIPCGFMKIDVEGWEAKVLRGSAPMIRECRPVLYVENDRTEKSDELLKLINGLGYKAYWHKTPLFRENNFRGLKDHPLKAYSSIDLLCLPAEVKFDRFPEAKWTG